MLYPVKAIIAKRPRKDGKNAISFQYCYSATHRVTVDPEVAIPAAYWNKKRQIISKSLPSEFGDSKVLNDNLSRMRKVIEALIDKGQRLDVPCLGKYVKGLFTPDLKIADVPNEVPIQLVPQKLDFFGHLDDYITFKEKKVVSPGSIRCLRDRLKAFQEHTKKKITFDALDYYFYLDFVDFLTFTYEQRRTKDKIVGLKVNTICKTIKNLRVFIRDRVRRKLIAPINMDDFKAVEEESDAVYLSLDEISRIYYLDLSKSLSLQKSRDLLVLGCLTGLRFSDFSTLSFADMRGDMLYKKTNKKDNWVVIPMTTESKQLFTKLYGGDKFEISNPVFNLNIKKNSRVSWINGANHF